jgi:hypothetical protein
MSGVAPRGRDSVTCFKCHQKGHYQNQCQQTLRLEILTPLAAEGYETVGKKRKFTGQGASSQYRAPPAARTQFSAGSYSVPVAPAATAPRHRDDITCFRCGKKGHYQNQCLLTAGTASQSVAGPGRAPATQQMISYRPPAQVPSAQQSFRPPAQTAPPAPPLVAAVAAQGGQRGGQGSGQRGGGRVGGRGDRKGKGKTYVLTVAPPATVPQTSLLGKPPGR